MSSIVDISQFQSMLEKAMGNGYRKLVKSLVDAYFAWVKRQFSGQRLERSSALRMAPNYSANQ